MLSLQPLVLIIDSDTHVLRVAKIMLPSDRFRVITATNKQDGYNEFSQYSPHIILMDDAMYFQDDDLVFHNKEVLSKIPVILLVNQGAWNASHTIPDTIHTLNKPFTAGELVSAIDDVIKPIISARSVAMTTTSEPVSFQFGIPSIDHQLYGSIYPQSFIMIYGTIGSGKSNLTRQFIMDGVKKNQQCLLISFETPKEKLDPIFRLSADTQSFLHICDASRWTQIQSKPWRNIDFVFDFISLECSHTSYQRIIIDSFSHGFAFWKLTDILKFVDLCRSLSNAENQCMLWTINHHERIETTIYHLAHVMDIGIRTECQNGTFTTVIEFSKWQSYINDNTSNQPNDTHMAYQNDEESN